MYEELIGQMVYSGVYICVVKGYADNSTTMHIDNDTVARLE